MNIITNEIERRQILIMILITAVLGAYLVLVDVVFHFHRNTTAFMFLLMYQKRNKIHKNIPKIHKHFHIK